MLALTLAFVSLTVASAVSALIALIVICVVIALIAYVVNQMAPPEPIRWAIWGIVLVVILVTALRYAGVLAQSERGNAQRPPYGDRPNLSELRKPHAALEPLRHLRCARVRDDGRASAARA